MPLPHAADDAEEEENEIGKQNWPGVAHAFVPGPATVVHMPKRHTA